MPAVAPARLVDTILDALFECGVQAALTSNVRTHPRTFRVIEGTISYDLWVYAWTITHGGATRSNAEYRIQMTSVASPLPMNPNGPTILIGWSPERDVFCGFDLSRHRTFTTGSPSVQVSLQVLTDAIQSGMAFGRKSNDEITVGFRRDQFLSYVLNVAQLHSDGAQVQTILQRAVAQEEITAAEIQGLTPERRRVVETVERLIRDARFRDNVLNAYGHRCAVTGIQLRLLDAAHILPVGATGSHDRVTNGIPLGPTYHRAFDRGLIYLDSNYVMRVNHRLVKEIQAAELAGGLDDFSRPLGRQINMPTQVNQRPSLEMIRRANVLRRIQAT